MSGGGIPTGQFKTPPWWVANSRPGANGVGIEWPKVLAEFNDYTGFLHAMRARAAERQIAISSENTHDVAGLSDRRMTQLLSLRTLHNIQSVRRVGILSLGPLLGVLGVKLVMVEDEDALKRFGTRISKRNDNLVHGGGITISFSRKFMQKIGKKGAKAKMTKWNAQRRSASARNAALKRWRKPKITEIKKRKKSDAGSNRPRTADRAVGTSPKAKPRAATRPRRRRSFVPVAVRSRAAPQCASMPE